MERRKVKWVWYLLEDEIEKFKEEIIDSVENLVKEELRIQIQWFENRIALALTLDLASLHFRQIPRIPKFKPTLSASFSLHFYFWVGRRIGNW